MRTGVTVYLSPTDRKRLQAIVGHGVGVRQILAAVR